MNLYTKTLNLGLDQNIIEQQLGKKVAGLLKVVCDNNLEVTYVKKNKHYLPEEDSIGFYVTKQSKYILIPIINLAKAVTSLPEEVILKELKSYLSSIFTKEEVKKVKDLAKINPDYINVAKARYISKHIRKVLDVLPEFEIEERNFWIAKAKKLGIKPPKTEDDITSRYIKTVKIYHLADQVGRNIPVALLRASINNLNHACYLVKELDDLQDVKGLQGKIIRTFKKKECVEEQKTNLDVKCQIPYPYDITVPTCLFLGLHSETITVGKKKTKVEQSTHTFMAGSIAFVIKKSETVAKVRKDGSIAVNSPKEDKLLIFIPIPADKKVDEVYSKETLCKVAYEMAVSLNYPLVRVDFK